VIWIKITLILNKNPSNYTT